MHIPLFTVAVLSACSNTTVPQFPLQVLQSVRAVRAKACIAADGRIEKFTVYVTRDAIPDWVHSMADQELGPGTYEH